MGQRRGHGRGCRGQQRLPTLRNEMQGPYALLVTYEITHEITRFRREHMYTSVSEADENPFVIDGDVGYSAVVR